MPNHNPGTTSAALKQGNSQALQAQLNYGWLTLICKLLSNRSNSSILPLIVSLELNTKSL
jgi:hypothetical protein